MAEYFNRFFGAQISIFSYRANLYRSQRDISLIHLTNEMLFI